MKSSIDDKQVMEQIKQSKNISELEEIARNNSLLDDMYNQRKVFINGFLYLCWTNNIKYKAI